jgi:hypothetical protein
MLRKLVIIPAVFCFIIAFSNLAWSSVEGSWYVQGKVTTKVSAKGQKSKIMKGGIDDFWTFDSDYDFEAEDIGGTWSQTGKKVIVSLNTEDVIANFEDMLSDELETDITVEEVTKMTFTGNEKKNGIMKGNFKIIMNIYSSENDMHGKATVSGRFKGYLLQPLTPIMVNYFPLDVGDKWVYSSFVQGQYRYDQITGTEAINGIRTFIKERIEPSPDNYHEKQWLAYDSSSVLLYRIWSNEGADPAIDLLPPVIENELNPQVGDEWSFGILNLVTENSEVLSVNDTVTVPAGTFTDCIKIMETETPSGKIHIKDYAPEVGMIRDEEPGNWVEELVYAETGSQTYGVAP